jgi:hypothetical protein
MPLLNKSHQYVFVSIDRIHSMTINERRLAEVLEYERI